MIRRAFARPDQIKRLGFIKPVNKVESPEQASSNNANTFSTSFSRKASNN